MPDQQPHYSNPRFARAYIRASVQSEERGAREHRRELLSGLSGVVCEVGAGHGLNFAHYPAAVTRVLAIEPEPTLRAHARTAAGGPPVPIGSVPIDVLDGTAAQLPVPDGSCDAAVAALVLCTVPSVGAALAEIARVLRPGGELRFYEHVVSDHRALAAVQHVIAPLWGLFAGGCHPDRDTAAVIAASGFTVTQLRRFGFSPAAGLPAFAHVLGRATLSDRS